MQLEDLSREDLIIVAIEMSKGKPLDHILSTFIPTDIRSIVQSIHSILCKEKHGIDDYCKYYIESSEPDPWNQPHHDRWHGITADILEIGNSSEVRLALDFLAMIEKTKLQAKKEGGEKVLDLLTYLIHFNCAAGPIDSPAD
jgi:hypothetical protein